MRIVNYQTRQDKKQKKLLTTNQREMKTSADPTLSLDFLLYYRCKQWLSRNDKVTYQILYNTLEDQLAATILGEQPEEDKKKAKGRFSLANQVPLFNDLSYRVFDSTFVCTDLRYIPIRFEHL